MRIKFKSATAGLSLALALCAAHAAQADPSGFDPYWKSPEQQALPTWLKGFQVSRVEGVRFHAADWYDEKGGLLASLTTTTKLAPDNLQGGFKLTVPIESIPKIWDSVFGE